jgi:O-succinylbenzoate synthase
VSQNTIPPLAELIASARVVSLPLRTRFRGLSDREILLFEGPNGWAEWAPFTEYTDEEAATWLTSAIEFGYWKLPELHRDRIAVNATLPAVSPELIEKVLSRFGEFQTVKIKVAESGQSLQQDLDRVFAVQKLYPEAKIRLDANGGYDIATATLLANAMHQNGVPLEYLEQPVATIAEMAELKLQVNRLGIKIAADESVRKVSDPLAVAQANAADILVLKVAPLGGIHRALEIAREAELPVVISSAIDSSVGLSMGAHLAAAIENLEFDCGLATSALLGGDVTREPITPKDGFIEVRRVEVENLNLETFKAEEHREDFWLERLERCYRLI